MSPRELQVIQLSAKGLNAKQMARELGLSEETIKTHRKLAIARLDAKNIVHAVAIAYERGMLKEVA